MSATTDTTVMSTGLIQLLRAWRAQHPGTDVLLDSESKTICGGTPTEIFLGIRYQSGEARTPIATRDDAEPVPMTHRVTSYELDWMLSAYRRSAILLKDDMSLVAQEFVPPRPPASWLVLPRLSKPVPFDETTWRMVMGRGVPVAPNVMSAKALRRLTRLCDALCVESVMQALGGGDDVVVRSDRHRLHVSTGSDCHLRVSVRVPDLISNQFGEIHFSDTGYDFHFVASGMRMLDEDEGEGA